jgi:beta-1,4-mannosyltransferase
MDRPLRVLQGEQRPSEKTNPYISMLFDSLTEAGVELRHFSWPIALFGRYDVLHLHWPEYLVLKKTPLKAVVSRILLVLLLIRVRLTKTPVVLTRHNATPHDRLGWVAKVLFAAIRRAVRHEIHLIATTTESADRPVTVIPHGHYRPWFRSYPRRHPVPGRVVSFGQLRPYKRLESLIEAFRRVPRQDCELRILGEGRQQYVDSLTRLAEGDRRIEVHGRHISDESLVKELTEAQLIVLPYPIVNSGALLLALSLDRPVLTIATPGVREVIDEVGDVWIKTAHDAITEEDIVAALSATSAQPRSEAPAFAGRDWDDVAAAHVELYRRLVSGSREGVSVA